MSRKTAVWGLLLILLVIGVIAAVRGFAIPPRLPAVPPDAATRAEIPGIPNARFWVAGDVEPFTHEVLAARQREAEFLARSGRSGALPPASFLAVSGGGDKGAFGAGLLVGWSESGSRPEFKGVTGVSTGALIAPFAFLGAEYDPVLRTVYTSIGPPDIAKRRNILAAITNDGMADNHPLWNLISRQVDGKLLRRIAEEYGKGRLLLVGTTNLDAQQPIVWNMGAIASRGTPEALGLFRRILLASAAIPGAFPPTMFRVELDGRAYEEMHVDGGAMSQVFLYPPRLREAAGALGEKLEREGRVYVIRNSRLGGDWASVSRRTISIAGRAIDSLIQTQGLGDLYRIYLQTQRDGFDYNLAYIDSDFKLVGKQEFDTQFMRALFDYGYRQGRAGYPWKKTPPRF
jgi:predicted acylesterase/phospholipase RssA